MKTGREIYDELEYLRKKSMQTLFDLEEIKRLEKIIYKEI